MERTIYFGHPVNTYNSTLENDLIKVIRQSFPEWKIENPNQPNHQEGYVRWKKSMGNGMLYFFREVLPKMEGGIFLPFVDGRFGAGVFGEAEFLFNRKKDIWAINYLQIIEILKDLKDLDVLSVSETRERVYIDGNSKNGMRNFFESHFAMTKLD